MRLADPRVQLAQGIGDVRKTVVLVAQRAIQILVRQLGELIEHMVEAIRADGVQAIR